jgi:predicted nucleotidyltransferase
MVKKNKSKSKNSNKHKDLKAKIEKVKTHKSSKKNFPTLKLKTERDIAMDFAQKVIQKFDTLVKAVVLFGSTAKHKEIIGSDIDIIIVVDDATINFDEAFIMWYREELGKIVQSNPYKKDLHINTVKITTWWEDLLKGDPTIINVIRYGDPLIDVGGFFLPLKLMLQEGRIKPTPESIYNVIRRIPGHILRSRIAEMSSIEGCYWAYVESCQALLMAIRILPPSPEKIPSLLKEYFVDKNLLKMKDIQDFNDLFVLHKKIIHGEIKNLEGKIIDEYQIKSEEFYKKSLKIINQILE